MRLFLGTFNVYGKFIKNVFIFSCPLNAHVRKVRNLSWSDPTAETLETFNTLDSEMVEPLVSVFLQPPRPYMINASASACALGVVYFPQQDNSNLIKWATIGY